MKTVCLIHETLKECTTVSLQLLLCALSCSIFWLFYSLYSKEAEKTRIDMGTTFMLSKINDAYKLLITLKLILILVFSFWKNQSVYQASFAQIKIFITNNVFKLSWMQKNCIAKKFFQSSQCLRMFSKTQTVTIKKWHNLSDEIEND